MVARLYINPLIYSLKAAVKLGPLDKEFEYSDMLWNTKIEKIVEIPIN
jgi:hypothetical protein